MDEDDFSENFTRALKSCADDSGARAATLDGLLADLAASRLRDLEPDAPMMEALLSLPHVAWEYWPLQERCSFHRLIIGLVRVPEMISAASLATPFVADTLLRATLERASRAPDPADVPAKQTAGSDGADAGDGRHHRTARGSSSSSSTSAATSGAATTVATAAATSAAGPERAVSRGVAGAADLPANQAGTPGSAQLLELAAIKSLLHYLYLGGSSSVRATMRAHLGSTLQALSGASMPPPGVRPLLELLASIVRGIGVTPTPAHHSLMRDVLAPLHKPTGRLDETTPVLSLYHEPLVHCLVSLLGKQPPLLLAVLPVLLACWPEVREGNTAKEVSRLPAFQCCGLSSDACLPHLTSEHLTPPRLASPRIASPRLTPPRLASPRIASPHPASPRLRCCCSMRWSASSSLRRCRCGKRWL